MKVIVNLSKNSAYSRLNGHTFEVKQFTPSIVALDVNGRIIDFTYAEIIIVDIQEEIKKALLEEKPNRVIGTNKTSPTALKLRGLQRYIKLNDIVLDPI